MVTRNLTFRSNNLGENVTLMLCFTPPNEDLFINQFPVAWKVTGLAANGGSILEVTWTENLAYTATQRGQGSIVTAGSYTPIKVGQTTTLRLDNPSGVPIRAWTKPVPEVPDQALAAKGIVRGRNETGGPAGIGLGFLTDAGTATEGVNVALTWPNVGNTQTVAGKFTPVLSAYVALRYKQSQIIEGELQQETPIWKKDLLGLQGDTTIVVSKKGDGSFVATEI
ncbi:hypothetical protein K466DRAFT_587848 [Polyporus arcularius HHB13444]|uniref:Uncharacterized protein n=1 Tax=Polyporus arcularius HHB13444 TaxID=1314778 RepID=A0A5C3P908_9APHY|nr:hypothetical protein K466DRAFT_587848 [Polyporus arcularius HHB13444]